MPDRVDAAVEADQATRPPPRLHHVARQPAPEQLPPGDDPMLPIRQLRDHLISGNATYPSLSVHDAV